MAEACPEARQRLEASPTQSPHTQAPPGSLLLRPVHDRPSAPGGGRSSVSRAVPQGQLKPPPRVLGGVMVNG